MTIHEDSVAHPIHKFHLATSYLNHLYETKKRSDPGFSYESWAAELGYKSRSFVKMVVSGKRKITTDFIETFCQKQKFSLADTQYFELMVSHEQAEVDAEKKIYFDKILEHQGRHKEKIQIADSNAFLSSASIPVTLTLLSFEDVEKKASALGKMLNISEAEIDRNIEVLSGLGLVQQNSQGQWQVSKNSFVVSDNFNSTALADYHKLNMQEAARAQEIEKKLRRFGSLIMPLGEPEFEQILQDIEALLSKAESKYDSTQLKNKRLYKLNYALYPVSNLQN